MSIAGLVLDSSFVPEPRQVYRFDPLEDVRWKRLISSHPRASVFHSAAWLDALRRNYGYKPLAFTTCTPDSELRDAAVFCVVDSWMTGKRLVSVPFSDHCDLLVDAELSLRAICAEISGDVERENLSYVEFRPTSPFAPIGYKLEHCAPYCSHRIDLKPSVADLFGRLHKNSIQRKIRRADRERLRYEEGRSEALLEAFNRLWVLTRRRHFAPPQPASWFRQLIQSFGNALKIRAAFKDKQPVAAILTIQHKDVLIYKYGCSDAAFHRYGGVHLLLWTSILEAKRDGLSVFDLGRTSLNNKGLIAFKDRWGATCTRLHYSRLSNVNIMARETDTEKADWKEHFVKRITPYLPDTAFRAVGSLMYRHLG